MLKLSALVRSWLEASSKKQKLTAALLVFSLLSTFGLLVMKDASETATDPLGSTPLYFLGVFVKLVGVLMLIVLSSVIFRRWLQFGPIGKSVRQMSLLETVRLSPKQALHLISIGEQRLLIGATDQNVTLISHIEGEFDSKPVETTAPQTELDFGSLLQAFGSHLSGKPSK